MNSDEACALTGFAVGDKVTIATGGFEGMSGIVLAEEEARSLRVQQGGEAAALDTPPGVVCVLLHVYDLDIPILFYPFQIKKMDAL